jgi:hypothetical protein
VAKEPASRSINVPLQGKPSEYGDYAARHAAKLAENAYAKDVAVAQYLRPQKITQEEWHQLSEEEQGKRIKAAGFRARGPIRAKAIADRLGDDQ